MPDLMWLSVPAGWLASNAVSLATAIIVFAVGWYTARFVSRRLNALLHRARGIDPTIRPLLVELVRYGIVAITLVIVMGQLGVQTASILTVVGAIGLAVALALQGTLSNIAAGLMLLWLRPINAGEYIDAEGIAGTVVAIGLFGTRLRSYDGIYLFTPNRKLWDAHIINYSREKTRMVEIKVGIGYEAGVDAARTALLELAGDPRVLTNPAPTVFVGELGASAVLMVLRVWVAGGDWWNVKIDLTERTKLAFDAAGISIPYNKLDATIQLARAPRTG